MTALFFLVIWLVGAMLYWIMVRHARIPDAVCWPFYAALALGRIFGGKP